LATPPHSLICRDHVAISGSGRRAGRGQRAIDPTQDVPPDEVLFLAQDEARFRPDLDLVGGNARTGEQVANLAIKPGNPGLPQGV